MDGKLLARLGAIIFVAFALTATAIEMARRDDEPASAPRQHDRASPNDPLRAAQRRCQSLGEAAARDGECLRIWAQTRERFLGAAAPTQPGGER
jgi:conjugative transfer region protein TrbK